MTEFCALRAKVYAYKLDDETEMKKTKGTKKCIVKREITFKNYADALFKDKVLIKSQQRFKINYHKVYTEEVNKIALSSNVINVYRHLIKLLHIHMVSIILLWYVKMRSNMYYKKRYDK